jgi:ectoine hydroxylase-related dioxygenase (phytanoyl-CoA dioxygenase family)
MMCGVWVALEDVHPDSGPLVVYPGSHRLDRLYARTVPVEVVRDGKWRTFVNRYAPRVMDLITQAGLKPVYYTPKTGSILIWHDALAHGGSQHANDSITSKSMVSHYSQQSGERSVSPVGGKTGTWKARQESIHHSCPEQLFLIAMWRILAGFVPFIAAVIQYPIRKSR